MKFTSLRHHSTKGFAAALAAVASTSVTVMAHPGHEHAVTPPQHAMHWLVEPEHLMGWIGAGCLLAVALKVVKAWNQQSGESQAVHPQRRSPGHE